MSVLYYFFTAADFGTVGTPTPLHATPNQQEAAMMAEHMVDERRAFLALRFLRRCLIRHGHARADMPVVRYYARNGVDAKLQVLDLDSGYLKIVCDIEFKSAEHFEDVSPKLLELVGTADVLLVSYYSPSFYMSGWRRIRTDLMRWFPPAHDEGAVWQQLYRHG
jgi:hypothetical protein